MMFYTADRLSIILCVAASLLAFCIGFGVFKKFKDVEYETIVQELPNEAINYIVEYRNYMISQWICLLVFWFDIKVEDTETKLLSPAPNQNAVYFFYKNIEIYAFFSWPDNSMEVKTSVLTDDNSYVSHHKMFSIANGSLPTNQLFKFISKAKELHTIHYELSADDVIAITQQLKIAPKDINEEAVKMRYFDIMADMMIMMRKKKNRKNKQLLGVYIGLVDFLWQQYDKEFLDYLDMSEEEFLKIQEQNSEKIEDNE